MPKHPGASTYFHLPGLDADVTSPFTLLLKGGDTLSSRFYRTGQFSRKTSVSVRTLRFYDKMGLLVPTGARRRGIGCTPMRTSRGCNRSWR